MIPQLDLRNFFLTGIFVTIYFSVFMYMIRLVFLRPIEKHTNAYKEQLEINKMHYAMYLRYKQAQVTDVSEREKNINNLMEKKQQEIMKELEFQIIQHEKVLDKQKEKILKEMEEEMTSVFTKASVLEYIRKHYDYN